MLSTESVKLYLEKVASEKPTPGGGSICALAATAGAALTAMIAGLTLGRTKYAASESDMRAIKSKADMLHASLLEDVDRDALAYDRVVEAFDMPKKTDKDRTKRNQAVQTAFKHAAEVPLKVAERALEVMDLAGHAITIGNPNAATDGFVGTVMARSAVLGAVYNVMINLESIKDEDFVRHTGERARHLKTLALQKEKEILSRKK